MKAQRECNATGWNTGLCQDYSRALSLWFASRIDARWVVRLHNLRNDQHAALKAELRRIMAESKEKK
jgi:hypothetical protein